jgi:hypothetical protein
MRHPSSWSITGRKPYLLVVTDTDIYYGGSAEQPSRFFRIDLGKLESAEIVGKWVLKALELKFRGGKNSMYVCPFAVKGSRVIADDGELYKLRNVINNRIKSAGVCK